MIDLKLHHILAGFLLLIIAIFVGGPVIEDKLTDLTTTEEDISSDVNESVRQLELSDQPVKYSISQNSTTTTYYRNPNDGTRIQLTETENTKRYVVQTANELKITEYGYGETTYVTESTQKLSNSNSENRPKFYQSLTVFDDLGSNYKLSEAVLKDTETQNDFTIKTYEVTSTNDSETTITIILKDNRVQEIEFKDKTVKLYYNADQPEKPEEPKSESDGEGEETDCSDLDHC